MLSPQEAKALSTTCDNIGVAVWLADPRRDECPIVFANHEVSKVSGYSEEELIGRSCLYHLGDGNNPDYLSDRCAACKKCGVTTTCRISRRKGGGEYLNLMTVRPLFVSRTCVLISGCHAEFKDSPTRIDMADHALKLSRLLSRMNSAYGPLRGSIYDLDVVYLNALLVRFESTYTRLKNALIRSKPQNWEGDDQDPTVIDTPLR